MEGLIDDPSSESDEDDEEENLRRRIVYRLKGGILTKLENGVQEFENLMEKRARKLMESQNLYGAAETMTQQNYPCSHAFLNLGQPTSSS